MKPEDLIQAIEAAGGRLAIKNERIAYIVPGDAVELLDALRSNREAVLDHLRDKNSIPAMPPGVRLLRWMPQEPPLILLNYTVVNDVVGFIHQTLHQLGSTLGDQNPPVANASARELTERLGKAGIRVEIVRDQRRSL